MSYKDPKCEITGGAATPKYTDACELFIDKWDVLFDWTPSDPISALKKAQEAAIKLCGEIENGGIDFLAPKSPN